MITVKASDVITVVPIRQKDTDELGSRCVVVYEKAGKIFKKETFLTARSIEYKLNKEYYIKIK